MQGVRDGDIGKLEPLFDRHHRGLFHYFLRLTSNRSVSEDLVQDVFYRILKYRQTYQPETSFRAWMYQIGRNALADYGARHKGEVALSEEAVELPSLVPAPDQSAQAAQETALLHRALQALPAGKREVLVLSRFQGLKYEEIAAVL